MPFIGPPIHAQPFVLSHVFMSSASQASLPVSVSASVSVSVSVAEPDELDPVAESVSSGSVVDDVSGSAVVDDVLLEVDSVAEAVDVPVDPVSVSPFEPVPLPSSPQPPYRRIAQQSVPK